MSTHSSYKLSEFTTYELNIMVFGFAGYVRDNDISETDCFILGNMCAMLVENIHILNDKRNNVMMTEQKSEDNTKYLELLNSYDGLVDYLIDYMYTSFDKLSFEEKWYILSKNVVTNLERHYHESL